MQNLCISAVVHVKHFLRIFSILALCGSPPLTSLGDVNIFSSVLRNKNGSNSEKTLQFLENCFLCVVYGWPFDFMVMGGPFLFKGDFVRFHFCLLMTALFHWHFNTLC